MLSVEMPLLQAQLKLIDKALEKGQNHLTWRSHAIDDFIRETTTLVKEAFDTLTAIKNNMQGVERVLEVWATAPLMKRKSTKTYSPAEYEEEHQAYLAARYAEISEGGKEIHKLLLASNRVLKVSKGAPTWRAYVEFINDIVIDGLARTVAKSLQYLNEQLDPAEIANNETVPVRYSRYSRYSRYGPRPTTRPCRSAARRRSRACAPGTATDRPPQPGPPTDCARWARFARC